MFKIFKKFWRPTERRKESRISLNAVVNFRILDGKDSTICSRMLKGKVLDISAEGLCIGTNTVQIDGLHIFHPASQHQNKLEIEVTLHPDLAPLRTLGEVRWYSRVEDETSKNSYPRIDLRRIGQTYSMVAGGFGVRSYRHRFTPLRLVIRSLSR